MLEFRKVDYSSEEVKEGLKKISEIQEAGIRKAEVSIYEMQQICFGPYYVLR